MIVRGEKNVTPAKAGVQRTPDSQCFLDSRLRGNDCFVPFATTSRGGFRFIHFPVSLFILSFLLAACFETIAPDVGPRGTLRFKSNQKDAVLEVDETRLGPIGMFEQSGVLLHPGEHRIVVSQKGYFKEYRLVTVVEDQLQTVEVNLTPVPD